MLMFYSGDGGARSNIPETVLPFPTVMLTFYHNARDGKMDGRLRAYIAACRGQEVREKRVVHRTKKVKRNWK